MTFSYPPRDSEEWYSYLYRLSEQLNIAAQQLQQQELLPQAVSQAQQETARSARELKALIASASQTVRREMEQAEQRLTGSVTAVSQEFGSFRENFSANLTATAEGILQQYGYDARLEALDQQAAGFASYRAESRGYIRQGFVEYDSQGVPIVGIAIGQNLRSATVDGLEKLDPSQSCAFYTADKVSFRIGGNEVAYVSNRRLYIVDAQITGSLTVGDWLMTHDNSGLTLQWIGG